MYRWIEYYEISKSSKSGPYYEEINIRSGVTDLDKLLDQWVENKVDSSEYAYYEHIRIECEWIDKPPVEWLEKHIKYIEIKLKNTLAEYERMKDYMNET